MVEPNRSSIPSVMGPSKTVCDMWTGGVYSHISLYPPTMVYISACIYHQRSFAAHTSGGPENSWTMSAWVVHGRYHGAEMVQSFKSN